MAPGTHAQIHRRFWIKGPNRVNFPAKSLLATPIAAIIYPERIQGK